MIKYLVILQFVYGVHVECLISSLGFLDTRYISIGQILYYISTTDAIAVEAWWWFLPPGLIIMIVTTPILILSTYIMEKMS